MTAPGRTVEEQIVVREDNEMKLSSMKENNKLALLMKINHLCGNVTCSSPQFDRISFRCPPSATIWSSTAPLGTVTFASRCLLSFSVIERTVNVLLK